MIYLILAIVSSMALAVVMRVSEKHSKNNFSMLAANYLMCSIIAVFGTGMFQGNIVSQEGFGFALGLGIINGAFYLAGLMLFQWNIRVNGVTLSALFMKMGVIVSILTAIIFFKEVPRVVQVIGMVLACIAIPVIQLEKGVGKVASGLGLVVLFVAGGITDAMSKVYEELGVAAMKNSFLFFTFISAFIFCVCLCLFKKQKLTAKDLGFGLLIGVPNYFSAYFLLHALADVPAVIAYPTYSVGTIIAVMLISRVIFKEKLSRRQLIALAMILIALVLLNV